MPEEIAATKRDSTLRFLEFLGQEMTGSRGLAQKTDIGTGRIRTLDSVLESLAVEAYLQVLKASWKVIPARFFGAVGLQATQPGPAG